MIKALETDFRDFVLREGSKVIGWCSLVSDTQVITRVFGKDQMLAKCKQWLAARPEIKFFDAYKFEAVDVTTPQIMIEIFL